MIKTCNHPTGNDQPCGRIGAWERGPNVRCHQHAPDLSTLTSWQGINTEITPAKLAQCRMDTDGDGNCAMCAKRGGCELYRRAQLLQLAYVRALNAAGLAGCTSTGGIVSRLAVPDAIPIAYNTTLGVAKPMPAEMVDKIRDVGLLDTEAHLARMHIALGSDRPAAPKGPKIVVMCGSSKWPDLHMQLMMKETLAGHVVIPLGIFGHADFPPGAREATADGDETTQIKQMLDCLHMAKIDLADEILVVNKEGYVGNSTRKEIAHAEARGIAVRFQFERCPQCLAWHSGGHDCWMETKCPSCGLVTCPGGRPGAACVISEPVGPDSFPGTDYPGIPPACNPPSPLPETPHPGPFPGSVDAPPAIPVDERPPANYAPQWRPFNEAAIPEGWVQCDGCKCWHAPGFDCAVCAAIDPLSPGFHDNDR